MQRSKLLKNTSGSAKSKPSLSLRKLPLNTALLCKQQSSQNQHLRNQSTTQDKIDASKALCEIILRQQGTEKKEKAHQRYLEKVISGINEQKALIEEENSRRQKLLNPFKWQQFNSPSLNELDFSEQPPPNRCWHNIDYYSDVSKDISKWNEAQDSDATEERNNKVSVVNDGNCAFRNSQQVFTSAFAPLTSHALHRLRYTFTNNRHDNCKLFQSHGISIYANDIFKLKPNCWLNDEVINAYFQLLVNRSECALTFRNQILTSGNAYRQSLMQPHKMRTGDISELLPKYKFMNGVPRITGVDSFFYSNLTSSKMKKEEYDLYESHSFYHQAKEKDVFAYDILLIPINLQTTNWSLGVIDFRSKTVTHYDSASKKTAHTVRDNLLTWLFDEARKKGVKGFEQKSWKIVDANPPHHINPNDCGVFTCKFGDWLSRGWTKFTFTNEHISYFRSRIAHEIMMGRVS